jgi:hypothetical protein
MSNNDLQERMDQIIVGATLTDEAASNSLYELKDCVILGMIEFMGDEHRFHEIYKDVENTSQSAAAHVPALKRSKIPSVKEANGKLVSQFYDKHKDEIVRFCGVALSHRGFDSLVAYVTEETKKDGDDYTQDDIALALYAGESATYPAARKTILKHAKIDAERIAMSIVVEELMSTYIDMSYGL